MRDKDKKKKSERKLPHFDGKDKSKFKAFVTLSNQAHSKLQNRIKETLGIADASKFSNEKKPARVSRTKIGYFDELEKWMATVKEYEAKAAPFVEYLKQNPEAEARARVDKFYSDGIWYFDAQGESKQVSLRTIQKAIIRRIENGFYKQ